MHMIATKVKDMPHHAAGCAGLSLTINHGVKGQIDVYMMIGVQANMRCAI